MTDINRIVLSGNLTKDPELRHTQAGQPVCKMRLACTTRWLNPASGSWEDRPNYFDVVAWGRMGENCAQHLAKGRGIIVDGRVEWREWEAREGGGKRQSYEVVADQVRFLDGAPSTGEREAREPVSDPGEIPF